MDLKRTLSAFRLRRKGLCCVLHWMIGDLRDLNVAWGFLAPATFPEIDLLAGLCPLHARRTRVHAGLSQISPAKAGVTS